MCNQQNNHLSLLLVHRAYRVFNQQAGFEDLPSLEKEVIFQQEIGYAYEPQNVPKHSMSRT
jgi:hypothetical protein